MVWSLNHIFNIESAEAQRCTQEVTQRQGSKPRGSNSLSEALPLKVVERQPKIGGFTSVDHITLAPLIVSQLIAADQLDHNDTCPDPFVLPRVDGRVDRCQLSTHLCCHPNTGLKSNGSSVYGEVGDTRFDELHVTHGDLLVVRSTCRHHGMPPHPHPKGLPSKIVILT